MKFISIVVAAAISVFTETGSLSFVSANTIRITFNNGNAQDSSTTCSPADNAAIDAAIAHIQPQTLTLNRRLRGTSMLGMNSMNYNATTPSADMGNALSFGRELFPAFCADLCAGYQPRTCRTAQCKGYRRRELAMNDQESTNDRNSDDRALQSASCNHVTQLTHSLFDKLVAGSRFSNTCKLFLARSTRTVDCIYNAVYGEITGLRALTTQWPSYVLSENVPSSGWSVCRSIGSMEVFALVNICVIEVNFVLTGPSSFNQTSSTFNAIVNVNTVGTYTLSVTPNRLTSKAKTYTFTSNNC